ncbi:MAG: hypothetical protein SX243_01610 [Acidobacteriota bacterium]|nr:hypothetical protein [Acidobacteriota bacterium]
MTYFRDLTTHTYTAGEEESGVLNVGWLGEERPYPTGQTFPEFHQALEEICARPILLHRGFHDCEFCPQDSNVNPPWSTIGNGQIRVLGQNGVWYSAPTMVHHYVTKHNYKPPEEFVEAVLNPKRIAEDET